MSWRILYIEESESLSLYLDNVKVKRGATELTFPLSDLCMVVIDNYKLILTVGLINACSTRNIPIVMCGDNHHPLNICLPLNGHFNGSKIFLDQIAWNDGLKEKIWQIIVKQKIKNQLYVMSHCVSNEEAEKILKNYIDNVELNDKTNREGLAAKVYFRAMFGPTFSRQDENVINAALNYGYAIIRAMISRTIVAKGLNPQLGIFHKGAGNAFNLSDDVIEIFRPMIDYFVYINFKEEKIFTRDCRIKLLEIIDKKVRVNEQNITLNHAIEKVVDGIINFFNSGSINSLIYFEPVLYDL